MSYCHQAGSVSLIQGFGPQPRALIRSRAEAANCIQNSSRNIVLGYPNGLETFRKGRSIQIYWGTSLSSGNVNIELSTNNGSSWQTIQIIYRRLKEYSTGQFRMFRLRHRQRLE
ncbi:MAG: hypothetical protein IPL53_15880 [Ignavibacteria bacterium]|nr:hypothetical protein [Ignavibacteria bacterium]